jgi:hypothetical protein
MWKLSRVAGAGMGRGNKSIRQIHLHEFIDVLENDLVAVEKDDALNTWSAEYWHASSRTSATHFIFGHSPWRQLLPGALGYLSIAWCRLNLVENNGRDAGGSECSHVLGIGFNITRHHDLELVFGICLPECVV